MPEHLVSPRPALRLPHLNLVDDAHEPDHLRHLGQQAGQLVRIAWLGWLIGLIGLIDPSTVTGSVASPQWGPVQVRLTMDSATITEIDVVQYPNWSPTSTEINTVALPILIQEALDAQSADIDMVSGATVTSEGFVLSLQSALDQVNA